MLEEQRGLVKISDNLVNGHDEIVGIPEYGITTKIQSEDLKIIKIKLLKLSPIKIY